MTNDHKVRQSVRRTANFERNSASKCNNCKQPQQLQNNFNYEFNFNYAIKLVLPVRVRVRVLLTVQFPIHNLRCEPRPLTVSQASQVKPIVQTHPHTLRQFVLSP